MTTDIRYQAGQVQKASPARRLGDKIPLARSGSSGPYVFEGTTDALVEEIRPALPLYVYRTERLTKMARTFIEHFPGDSIFAVKSNPNKFVIQALYRSGIRGFDVASIEEVRLVRRMAPKAKLYFMHPVKSPEAIAEAYHLHGVRAFVFDHEDELYKIIRETGLAQDLELFVRTATAKNGKAAIDFSSKFGATSKEAVELLKTARPVAARLGLCFHVGHQTSDPGPFKRAVMMAKDIIRKSGVQVDVLDVGGGFPVALPGQDVPPVETFLSAIRDAVEKAGLGGMALVCEPGRTMVADCGSLIVRVEGRKGDTLYLNDGTYGGLYDAGAATGWRFPVRAIPADIRRGCQGNLHAFRFFGPTCDSTDMMAGPFMLPADIDAGDWIEIGNLGGYSQCMRTDFNGFAKCSQVFLQDPAPAAVK